MVRLHPPDGHARRNTGIDLFRGALVIGVMLGHYSELIQRGSFLTWFGFGFRMPVFIGLTGYLFHLERARTMPLSTLWAKYYRRLILPWLVACAVYLTICGQIGWRTPLDILVRPPFHLWFVPVMIAFMFAASISRMAPPTMLAIAVPFSIAAMYLFGVGHGIEQYADWVPDRRYFVYPIYFFFGLWVARRVTDPRKRIAAIMLALIGLLWWSRLYDRSSPAAEVAAELILCLPLIALLPWIRGISFQCRPLGSIGRDSLFFYLWHPLAFALWTACGMSGLPMLAVSLLSLGAMRWAIARCPSVNEVLGVQSKDRAVGAPSPDFPATVPIAPAP